MKDGGRRELAEHPQDSEDGPIETDEIKPQAGIAATGSARRIQQLELQVARQQEMIRWLESELESVRRSITWRGTEPVRQVYARVQALQRALAKEEPAPIQAIEAPIDVEPASPGAEEPVLWTAEVFAEVAAQPISPVTDLIVCVGQETDYAEKCIASIRRYTDPAAYRLNLAVHEEDLARLSAEARRDARLITHTMRRFNFRARE